MKIQKLVFYPLSILVFSVFLLRGQSPAILRGEELPDFDGALTWKVGTPVDGEVESSTVWLPVLDACKIGDYSIGFYFYRDSVLWHYSNFPMYCAARLPVGDLMNDEDKVRFSTRLQAMGRGRWYGVIREVGCGVVFVYEVRGLALAWRRVDLGCK